MQLPPAANPPQSSGPATPANNTTSPAVKKSTLETLSEVVYVLMDDDDGGEWMCTGTLVAKDLVLTAGHCLDDRFTTITVVAPGAAGKPRITASASARMSDDYEDISEADVGFLRLDEPITLPSYAVLTDVSARVAKGEKLTAATVVRAEEDFEAAFKGVDDLAVTSTTKQGYDHGIATPFFSHGGDSGAGLFLVENGQTTHKLIGFARQPDPDVDLDHFTRVDADFLKWFAENK